MNLLSDEDNLGSDNDSTKSDQKVSYKKRIIMHDDKKKITMNDIQVLPFKLSVLKPKD